MKNIYEKPKFDVISLVSESDIAMNPSTNGQWGGDGPEWPEQE